MSFLPHCVPLARSTRFFSCVVSCSPCSSDHTIDLNLHTTGRCIQFFFLFFHLALVVPLLHYNQRLNFNRAGVMQKCFLAKICFCLFDIVGRWKHFCDWVRKQGRIVGSSEPARRQARLVGRLRSSEGVIWKWQRRAPAEPLGLAGKGHLPPAAQLRSAFGHSESERGGDESGIDRPGS